ncbi:MAG: BACON domain-containing carbohydrate-binding protein [Deltaproteobacteria bacterium]|nr:BACON domain-containing carbohydrate-binding protein [Deltaproteobacteria bacterium]
MCSKKQMGFALIPLIVAMVLMAALGAGIYGVTTSSTFSELMAGRDFGAYQLAKGGMRYAINYPSFNGGVPVPTKEYCLSNSTQCFTIAYNSATKRYTVTGKVNPGSFLAASRQLAYFDPTITPGLPFNPVPEFNIPKQDLDKYFSPTANSETDIKSVQTVGTGIGNEALNLKSDFYTMGLKWYDNPAAMGQFDTYRTGNCDLLNYHTQVKVDVADNTSDFNMVGISFRLDDTASTYPPVTDNMYGISFFRIDKLSTKNIPAWYSSLTTLSTNAAWLGISDNFWYVVLWKRVGGALGPHTLLSYQKLTLSLDKVVDQDTVAPNKLNAWATLSVGVEEKIGTGVPYSGRYNIITSYLADALSYPYPRNPDASTPTINWNLKPINWTLVGAAGPSGSNIINDNSLTTKNYDSYPTEPDPIKARELGLHIYYDSTSAKNVFYDNWYIVPFPSASCVGCTYSLSSAGATIAAAGSAGSTFSVTAGVGCTWTAATTGSWIHTSSSGTGTGAAQTVNYTVDANAGPLRTGTITVGGQTFTVTQSSGCTYSLSSAGATIAAAGSAGSTFSVTAGVGCTWTAATTDSWIHTSSSGTGTGAAQTVNYTVDANAGPLRTGTITVGGQTFTVTQASGCTYALSPTSQSFSSSGGTNNVVVTAGTGCTWNASEILSWVAINSGTPGSGNGTVNYTVDPNSSTYRNGSMTIAGTNFPITQAPACSGYSVYNNTDAGYDFKLNGTCTKNVGKGSIIPGGLLQSTKTVDRYTKNSTCGTYLDSITYQNAQDANKNNNCNVNYDSANTASDR